MSWESAGARLIRSVEAATKSLVAVARPINAVRSRVQRAPAVASARAQ
jgi:hypothetical protein